MQALRAGCLKYKVGYKPKFVYIIGTKRHFKKFFAVHERVENLTPGSVICTKFVREDFPEFFMQSHYPLKVYFKLAFRKKIDSFRLSYILIFFSKEVEFV